MVGGLWKDCGRIVGGVGRIVRGSREDRGRIVGGSWKDYGRIVRGLWED